MSAKKDFTQVAFEVFQQAVGEAPKPAPLEGRKANSSKGGKIGGVKRAEAMSAEERAAQAIKAAQTRWDGTTPPRKSRANQTRKNEAITVDLVSKHFRALGYGDDDTIVIEREQTTDIARINKLLATASKKGSGKGYPDFIVTYKPLPDFVLVVECKADITKHQSATLDNYSDYAVDGARLYADYLSREMDVLYLGVSGQTEQELKVSHFLRLKGEADRDRREIFKDCGLQDFPSYLEQLKNYRFRVDYEDLLKYVSGLNEQLHSKKIPENQRAILFSGILIALEDDDFKEGYKTRTDAKRLAKYLVESIIAKLDASNVPQERQAGLKAVFAAIQSHTGLIADGYLLTLVREIDERIRTFIKGNAYLDIISRCYVEFLKYANDDGSLGIVLTPQHIAGLFCDIAQLNADSVVVDNCCGTGSFLVAAMNKMVGAAKGSKRVIEHIKAKQVLGIEWQNHIFNLCVSNMIIHGDGKSNIWNGDCFKLIDQLKPFHPNVALLNPPYNDVSGIDELVFIENALSILEKNGTAVAIVPMRCALYDKGQGLELKARILKKHTLDAVMSMPDELFYPKGVVCCVMVFKAHVPHDENGRFKTWFGYWKNDGFVKVKHRGRTDTKAQWDGIKEGWLTAYQNREVVPGESVSRAVLANEEWCAEAYMETDYSTLTKADFELVVKNYAMFRLLGAQSLPKSESDDASS
jgi:predicted RNA methylase